MPFIRYVNDTVCTNDSLVFARLVFANQEDSWRTVKRNKRANQNQFGQINCFLRNIRQRTCGHAFLLEFSEELRPCVFRADRTLSFRRPPTPPVHLATPHWGYRLEAQRDPEKEIALSARGRDYPLQTSRAGTRKTAARAQWRYCLSVRPAQRRQRRHGRTHAPTHARPPRFAPLRQLHCIPAALSTGSRCCEPISCRAWPQQPRWARGRQERARGEADSETNGKWGRLSLCLGPGTEVCLRAALIARVPGGPVRLWTQVFVPQGCHEGYCCSGMGCGKERVAGRRA